MKSRLLPLSVFYFIIDVYCFFGLKSIFTSNNEIIALTLLFIAISLLTYYSFYKLDKRLIDLSIFQLPSINGYVAIIALSFISKIVFASMLLFYDVVNLLGKVVSKFGPELGFDLTRNPSVICTILILTTGVFLILLYGLTIGKYNYQIIKLTIPFHDLPKAFDGYRILQISDIHAGSYDNTTAVKKAVQLINKQKADLILFTGDLINDHKDEINPYIDIFADLKATDGVYAVLGNHDYYGVYRMKDKEAYWKEFMSKFEAMNWNLLNNQSAEIKREGSSLKIVGIENWGASRWFPKRGDLDQALKDCKPKDFCILLSHDPTHWEHVTLKHSKKIHLTLSGHTHGFQFGINMLGFKWSPAKYSYPRWMGLYKEQDQYLYVNKGLGFLAFPGRIGMRPEITVIELKATSA